MKCIKYLLFGVAITSILSGCITTKTPVAFDGSKTDGTIIIGATIGEFDEIDWSGADAKAEKRCRAWGYDGAKAFEGLRVKCVNEGTTCTASVYSTMCFSTCSEKEVSLTFQCVD